MERSLHEGVGLNYYSKSGVNGSWEITINLIVLFACFLDRLA